MSAERKKKGGKVGKGRGREETRREGKERRGERERERERERARERGGGVSGCSSSCGPGGELPSPGCSAETSMGGCVGSHHDSSGSLNENSDGTGGNLSTSFQRLQARVVQTWGASSGLSACCPGWRSLSLSRFPILCPSQADRAGDKAPLPPPRVPCSSQRG